MRFNKHNTWKADKADKLKFIHSSEKYFKLFKDVAEKAQHSIYIIGWDFNINAKIINEKNNVLELDDFLLSLVNNNKDLDIYINIWNAPLVYDYTRSKLKTKKKLSHPRIHVSYIDANSEFESYHEKFVVIDNRLVFVGGMDLSDARWDTIDHKLENKLRKDRFGESYEPYADMQVMMAGNIANPFLEMAKERVGNVKKTPAEVSLWPQAVKPDFENIDVYVSRTKKYLDLEKANLEQVKNTYLDLIKTAKKYIYIENQYLNSKALANAVKDKLKEINPPEILIVLQKALKGTAEKIGLENQRNAFINSLKKSDAKNKLKILYPDINDINNKCIRVHSKLIIADDKYISVGSANISDRSLMYDDEVNITVKAENKEKIRQVLSAHLRNYINTPINKIYTMFKEKRSLFEIAQIKESKLKTLKAKGRTGRYFKFVAELANPKGFSRVYKYLFNMIKKTARLIKGFFKK